MAVTVGYLHGCRLGGYRLHGRVFERWRRWLAYVAACVVGWMLVVLRYCRLCSTGCVCRGIRRWLYPESSGW